MFSKMLLYALHIYTLYALQISYFSLICHTSFCFVWSAKCLNLPIPLLYDLHWLPINSWIQYKIAFICFHIVSGIASLLYTSLSCFISTLLLTRPHILRSAMFLGLAGGPWGRDPFNTSDPWSGTLLLSLSGILPHSLLLSQNWKNTFSLLHTDLLFSFFSFYQPITSNACICSVCVCVFVCVYVCVCECVFVCLLCDKMSMSVGFCKHARFLRDRSP